jgi:uncharacterized protein (DUF433 family)
LAAKTPLPGTRKGELFISAILSKFVCINQLKMEQIFDRIFIDPEICGGKPIIRGKRITVQTVIAFLGAGEPAEEILKQFPSLEPEDIAACLRYAAALMEHGFVIKQAVA